MRLKVVIVAAGGGKANASCTRLVLIVIYTEFLYYIIPSMDNF